HNELQNIAMEP
ncbi:hypothetical protein CFC21_001829, partial [Triticum aestivum]